MYLFQDIWGILISYSSVVDIAWSVILSDRFGPSFSKALRALFQDDDDNNLEEYHFSKLHSIVLGLVPGRLEEELARPGVEINATDSRGRTALSWAIGRQDHIATKLLLNYKADLSIINNHGDSPLAFAAFGNNIIGLRLLLEAGATITQKDSFGRNCLHLASIGNHTDTLKAADTIEVLIAAGCDIHEKNDFGSTPLNIAAQYSSSAMLRSLMSHGSEINTIDLEGDCPLLNALLDCKDENTRLLLERGADYTKINNLGHTILHRAAQSGSLQTLEILRSAKLSRIDPNAKDKKGKTAFQLVQERYNKPEGFINLFLTLVFEIRCRNDALISNGEGGRYPDSVEASGLSGSPEAGGDGDSHAEGRSEANNTDASRDVGATELRRGHDENDGETGEEFFDALEQQ